MDIVERLRRINAFLHVTEDEPEYDYKLSYEAAEEIERLRNKVRWLEMCENTIVKQENKIDRLLDALRWALPYVKTDERVNDIVRAALKEG